MSENMKDIISDEIRNQLRADLPKEAYKAHPTKSYLTTIKAMYVIERLNDVFGLGRWTLEHEVIKEDEGQVLIKGTLVILDYECVIPTQYGSHAITGKGVDLADGYKSAITDCLSKTASYLEIGIEVFKGNVSPSGTDKKVDKEDPKLPWLNTGTKEWNNAIDKLQKCTITIDEIKKYYTINKVNLKTLTELKTN